MKKPIYKKRKTPILLPALFILAVILLFASISITLMGPMMGGSTVSRSSALTNATPSEVSNAAPPQSISKPKISSELIQKSKAFQKADAAKNRENQKILASRLPAKRKSPVHALEAPLEADASAAFEALFGSGGGSSSTSKKPARKVIRQMPALSTTRMQASGALGYSYAPQADYYSPPTYNRESYDSINGNRFLTPLDQPLSTFSIDVDTAGYSNMRRMLNHNQLPSPGSVRIEELINYFPYNTPEPLANNPHPFAIYSELADCPWNPEHSLLKVHLKGKEIPLDEKTHSNLVFLIDVSGSMSSQNKLPLVKKSMKLLIDRLKPNDRVAFVVYAGASGLALPSTTANNTKTLLHALNNLQSGGSTNGGAGIQLAYKIASENFIEKGNNRVILCTDGDFNVGISNRNSLETLIKEKAKSGVFLSILGYGMGNYQDATMEQLSNSGNGNYSYIDTINEARKVLIEQASGTLHTIAKDVKIQVEWNPEHVGSYRLIGYVNRTLAAQDFNNDKKDAGEIGAGHSVTAFYEIIPSNLHTNIDPLKYQPNKVTVNESNELGTIKFRYKKPDESHSHLITKIIGTDKVPLDHASEDFRFASAVAGFGMLLNNSDHKQQLSCNDILHLAQSSTSYDPNSYRQEFISLIHKAHRLQESFSIR